MKARMAAPARDKAVQYCLELLTASKNVYSAESEPNTKAPLGSETLDVSRRVEGTVTCSHHISPDLRPWPVRVEDW